MAAEAPLAMDLSTSGDSSESDFDEIDASPEDMDTIMQLETALQTNPNLYESHVQVYSTPRSLQMSEFSVEHWLNHLLCCSTSTCCENASFVKSSGQQENPCKSTTRSQSNYGWSGYMTKLSQPRASQKQNKRHSSSRRLYRTICRYQSGRLTSSKFQLILMNPVQSFTDLHDGCYSTLAPCSSQGEIVSSLQLCEGARCWISAKQ